MGASKEKTPQFISVLSRKLRPGKKIEEICEKTEGQFYFVATDNNYGTQDLDYIQDPLEKDWGKTNIKLKDIFGKHD